jgi:cyclase
VSIDTCATERRTRAYLAAIETVSTKPIKTLINTHHHGDHTHGNYLLKDATIIAHAACRDEMLAAGKPHYPGVWTDIDWGDLVIAPPFVTYTDGVTVYVDDRRCEVRHVGTAAHTTNDSIVWIPDLSVLYAGDLLFNGGTPFLLMGSVEGAIEAVEGLKIFGAETIVPGHGDVCGAQVIDDVLGYLGFVRELAASGRSAGITPLEAARESDLGPYREWLDTERIVGNLHRAYAELDGLPRGAKLDIPAVIADMLEYNGGKPLTCLA